MLIVSPDTYLVNDEGQYEWSPARATQAWDRAFQEFDAALERLCNSSVANPCSALLTVGIPGSGKTTWIERLKNYEILLQHYRLEPHFEGVVFDATLTTRIARRPLIEMAKRRGTRIEAVVFDAPLISVLERNAERPPDRRVPYETIVRMLRQIEAEPPTLNEGLWRITSASVWPG